MGCSACCCVLDGLISFISFTAPIPAQGRDVLENIPLPEGDEEDLPPHRGGFRVPSACALGCCAQKEKMDSTASLLQVHPSTTPGLGLLRCDP